MLGHLCCTLRSNDEWLARGRGTHSRKAAIEPYTTLVEAIDQAEAQWYGELEARIANDPHWRAKARALEARDNESWRWDADVHVADPVAAQWLDFLVGRTDAMPAEASRPFEGAANVWPDDDELSLTQRQRGEQLQRAAARLDRRRANRQAHAARLSGARGAS